MLRRGTAHACKWRIKSDMEGKLIFRFAVLFCRRGGEGGDGLTAYYNYGRQVEDILVFYA